MGQGYTRNDTPNNIANGNVITAADLDGEFDAIVASFNETTGHTHDGTAAEGGAISILGPVQEYLGDGTAFYPKTTAVYTLGKASHTWANLYLDTLTLGGTAVTSTAAELNVLDGIAATLTFTELNYVDGVTSSIQTQLNTKAPIAGPTFTGTVTIPTADINGGTIDGVTIGGASAGAAAFASIGVTGASVLASVDINSGTIDGVTIGGASPGAAAFTTVAADSVTSGKIGTQGSYGFVRSSDGALQASMSVDNTNLSINNGVAGAIKLSTNSVERMWIDSVGNVGIGVSPNVDSRIHVYGADGNNKYIRTENNNGTSYFGTIGTGAAVVESNTSIKFTTGGSYTERMRIDASGNVGIGGTPEAWSGSVRALEFDGQASDYIGFNSATSGYLMQNTYYDGTNNVYKNSGLASAYGQSAGVHSWYGAASGTGGNSLSFIEHMRIDSTGDLLVSKTTTDHTVEGFAVLAGGTVRAAASSTHAALFNRLVTDGEVVALYRGFAAVGTISVTASATAYNTTSDYRLKENITPIQGAGDIIKAMRPATYTFKADGSWADGFIAHELQELHPAAVTGSKDAMKDEEYEVTPAVYEDVIIPAVEAVAEVLAVFDDEGVLVSEGVSAVEAEPERTEQRLVSDAVMGTRSVPDYQGVDYSKLTPILTAALQEALNKIDDLTARIVALEAAP
jgi:hypothetical protein